MLLDHITTIRNVEEDIFDAIAASPAPIILWGAGNLAFYIIAYLHQHELKPKYICNNNPVRHGTTYLTIPVYGYEEIKEKLASQGGTCHFINATGPEYKEAILAMDIEGAAYFAILGAKMTIKKCKPPSKPLFIIDTRISLTHCCCLNIFAQNTVFTCDTIPKTKQKQFYCDT